MNILLSFCRLLEDSLNFSYMFDGALTFLLKKVIFFCFTCSNLDFCCGDFSEPKFVNEAPFLYEFTDDKLLEDEEVPCSMLLRLPVFGK